MSGKWGQGRSVSSSYRMLFVLLPVIVLVVLAGCSGQRYLMPAPAIYERGDRTAFVDVPARLQNNRCEIIYATDRVAETRDGMLTYGYGRSKSLAFGICTVKIGRGLSWDVVASQSVKSKRTMPLWLSIGGIREVGRFAETGAEYAAGTQGVSDSDFIARNNLARRELCDELEQRLALTTRREVWIYVHGYNSSFDDAAFRIAELWHFLGREGVPIVYTWPSRPAILAYASDHESSEFTVTHLKQFIRDVASCPSVAKVHIIAHSMGTSVAMSAIRELTIETRGAGRDITTECKLGKIILAAPDLDPDVVSQRFGAEGVLNAGEGFTVYVSKYDKAMNVATRLFARMNRLGRCRWRDVYGEDPSQTTVKALSHVTFVNAEVQVGFLAHAYFLDSPAVSSDVVLALRYDTKAGEDGRGALQRVVCEGLALDYWNLYGDYPNVVRKPEIVP